MCVCGVVYIAGIAGLVAAIVSSMLHISLSLWSDCTAGAVPEGTDGRGKNATNRKWFVDWQMCMHYEESFEFCSILTWTYVAHTFCLCVCVCAETSEEEMHSLTAAVEAEKVVREKAELEAEREKELRNRAESEVEQERERRLEVEGEREQEREARGRVEGEVKREREQREQAEASTQREIEKRMELERRVTEVCAY